MEEAVNPLLESAGSVYADVILPPPPLSDSTNDIQPDVYDNIIQLNPLPESDEGPETPEPGLSDKQVELTPVDPPIFGVSHETEPSYAEAEVVRTDCYHDTPENGSERPASTTVANVQYSVRYIGSVQLPEGDISGERITATMTECITTLTKRSNKSSRVTFEFKEKQKIFLKLEQRELKLTTGDKSAKVILSHPLNKIRAWAVGQEVDSRHFAYVIRNRNVGLQDGYLYVCRVFKCDVKAREVATALRTICQHRAASKAVRDFSNNY